VTAEGCLKNQEVNHGHRMLNPDTWVNRGRGSRYCHEIMWSTRRVSATCFWIARNRSCLPKEVEILDKEDSIRATRNPGCACSGSLLGIQRGHKRDSQRLSDRMCCSLGRSVQVLLVRSKREEHRPRGIGCRRLPLPTSSPSACREVRGLRHVTRTSGCRPSS
jgi:hypothetical protein